MCQVNETLAVIDDQKTSSNPYIQKNANKFTHSVNEVVSTGVTFATTNN